ncbi:hypothetical protein [Sphingomonas sp. CLY1604]|uniref:hypothetical protein n=1 Tax=Sphingomonas sp. CLY1604 TaxID=3457786 RepID=UPI003FD8226B
MPRGPKKPFFVSSVLLDLLGRADVAPRRLNAAMDRRVGRGLATWMNEGDPLPKLIARACGVPITSLSRANRHLLLRVESLDPHYHYHEYTKGHCILRLPGLVADGLHPALIGGPARRLALVMPSIDDLVVTAVETRAASGVTEASLTPDWTRFR